MRVAVLNIDGAQGNRTILYFGRYSKEAGGSTLKRFSWGMVAAVAITGLAWLGTSPAASGQTIGTTINTTVGHSLIRGLGSGATFGVASCKKLTNGFVPWRQSTRQRHNGA